MKLTIDNGNSVLHGADQVLTDKLNAITSYRVVGHHFVTSFRRGLWDGRIRLLRRTRDGGLRFPSGLLLDVLKVIDNVGHGPPELDDIRRPLEPSQKLHWLAKGIELRDYQREAVDLAMGSVRSPLVGRGILKLPIRSGKTVIAAALFHRLSLKGIYVATSQLILRQTVELFKSIFGEVGVIGEGELDPGFITVASIQRLQKMDEPIKRLLKSTDVLIVDEVHHMQGDSWREPILQADARYKVGLSATVTVSRKLCERSAIWLKSITGPIVIDVPIKRLIDAGYILAPDIFLANVVVEPELTGVSYSDAYDKLVVHGADRNRVIIAAASILAEAGHRVLIDTGRLAHMKKLYTESIEAGLDASIIYGATSHEKRRKILDNFTSGQKPVLIGTVMGEGVDVPVLSAVINAEGGKSPTATMQRMRNLTQHPDKRQAILVDFMDHGNRYLKSHSRARFKQYKSETAFKVSEPMAPDVFLRSLSLAISR